jgi:hypothetical protein
MATKLSLPSVFCWPLQMKIKNCGSRVRLPILCAVALNSFLLSATGLSQAFNEEELRIMIERKDYPEFTDSEHDRALALELLKLLGGHRDTVGNVYLSQRFTDDDMPILIAFQDAPGIEVGDSPLGDSAMNYLCRMKGLTYFGELPKLVTDEGISHLRGTPLKGLALPPLATDRSMMTLTTMSRLRSVCLSKNVTDQGFRDLARCKELVSIGIGASQVTDAAFANIGQNPKLTTINLGTAPNITPEVVKHLRQLRQLHWLEGPRGTNDRTLELLAEVKTLTRLELSSYAGVTDEGMKYLPAHEWMHDLVLGENITDAGMPYIGQLKWLGNLDLTKTQVTGEGLAFLGPIGPSKLEISDSVSDEGLAHISKFTGLEYLILNGNFTDVCLPHLPKRLHQVKFAHTKITDAGLNRLRRERLGLIIEVQREEEASKLFDQRSIDLGRGTVK